LMRVSSCCVRFEATSGTVPQRSRTVRATLPRIFVRSIVVGFVFMPLDSYVAAYVVPSTPAGHVTAGPFIASNAK